MSDIQTYLQQILDAVYGEEVRGSIHDAIATMNTDLEAAIRDDLNPLAFKGDLGVSGGTNNNLNSLIGTDQRGVWRLLGSRTYTNVPTGFDNSKAAYLVMYAFGTSGSTATNIKQELHYFSSSDNNENIYWSRIYGTNGFSTWDKNITKSDLEKSILSFPSIVNQASAESNNWHDVTDLPSNKVYSIASNITTDFGVPSQSYAVLMKYSPDGTNNFCVYLYNKYPLDSDMYYAITYSDTTASDIVWNRILKPNDFRYVLESFPSIVNQASAESNNWHDVTDLPSNKVYSIASNITTDFGVPAQSYAVLMKYSPDASNNFCVYLYNKYPLDSDMYYAITYSDTTASNIVWNRILKPNDFLEHIRSVGTAVTSGNYSTELPNANAADNNSIYRLFFNPGTSIPVLNMPYETTIAFAHYLITFGLEGTMGYRVQIYVNDADERAYRFGYGNGTWESWKKYGGNTSYVYITPEDDVLQKWIDAYNTNTTDIFFGPGEYDVISIYKNHFGNDFFDNYTGYSSGGNAWGRGLKLGNNIHYHFNDNSVFKATYTGSNQNVTNYFSIFASDLVEGGFYVEGLRISECNGLRYAIHYDFSLDSAYGQTSMFKNCYFDTEDRPIGAGLRNGDTLSIENCILLTRNEDCVNVHIPATSGHYGKVVITGCYSNANITLSEDNISINTSKSTALITNNTCKSINKSATFNVYEFNNIETA